MSHKPTTFELQNTIDDLFEKIGAAYEEIEAKDERIAQLERDLKSSIGVRNDLGRMIKTYEQETLRADKLIQELRAMAVIAHQGRKS